MLRTDYFNEAIVTAMLAAGVDGDSGAIPAQTADVPDETAATEDMTKAPILRMRMLHILQEAYNRAVADGIQKEYAEAADFAVCAFIDETLLSSSWQGSEYWMSNPLQLARHATATAGEEFYRILDTLLEKAESDKLPAPSGNAYIIDSREDPQQTSLKASLEIFALCLAQGFTGMFFNDRDAVRARLHKIGRVIPAVAWGEALGRDAPLFPAAYPANPPRRKKLGLSRRFDALDWLLWLAPPLITALLYYFCDARLNDLVSIF